MDCPHCSAENLIGATVCASCGKAMMTRPRFLAAGNVQAPGGACDEAPDRRAAAMPARASYLGEAPERSWGGGEALHGGAQAPAAPAPAGPEAVLCRICRGPFERPAEMRGTDAVCPSCEKLTQMSPGAQLGSSDVQMHPATAPIEDFRSVREFRLKPVERKASLRVGPIVAVSCLVLGLATMGVVKLATRKPDRAAALVGDVRAESSDLRLAPESEQPLRWETTITLAAVREESRGQFGALAKTLDLQQVSTQSVEAALVRTDDLGAVFDVRSEVHVGRQTGVVRGDDARDVELHPFGRHKGAQRMRAQPSVPTASLEDHPLLAARDLPPFFAIGDYRSGARTLSVGDKWSADLALPVLADGSGRLVPVTLRAEFAYAGRAVRSGIACAALKVRAVLSHDTQTPVDEDFNRKQGELAGAVFVELTTGLVADASVEGDFHLWSEHGKVENEMRVKTRLDVRRR
ncbi:MAG: hypothetical protein HMLKMBBP_00690 [Planctomycetes bacterium]|nr:hypothetical protein [Planctomycetota bacterium]